MGVEEHSYGSNFLGIPRRSFVSSFCAVGFLLMSFQLIGAVVVQFLYPPETTTPNCVGTMCYEVFSCYGFRDSTEHIRQPIAQLFGAGCFLLGFLGSYCGSQWQLDYGGKGIQLLGATYIAMGIFDILYTKSCDAYSMNIIYTVLTPFGGVPPSPLGLGTQDNLKALTSFPVWRVAEITHGFNVLPWYSGVIGLWSIVLLYVGSEAKFLSQLVERGPLGLGVNYGLNQWDEVLNHDAIRVQKEKLRSSPFIDDAQLPLPFSVPAEVSRGYPVAAGNYDYADYGSAGQVDFGGKPMTQFLPYHDDDI